MSFFKSITWKYISKFGENKIINRSYIYLIIVPIIAKLLSKIQSPISIFLGGEKVELVVELPFNWKLFFFSALIFSVASGLYSIFVPKIISENKSYGSFLNEGKTFIQIVGFMDNLKITDEWIKEQKLEISEVKANGGYNYAKRIISKNQDEKKAKRSLEKIAVYNSVHRNIRDYNDRVLNRVKQKNKIVVPDSPINPPKDTKFLRWSFWTVFKYANSYNSGWIKFIFSLYLTGFLIITWIFIENIILVLSY